jgi:hypothetical protein
MSTAASTKKKKLSSTRRDVDFCHPIAHPNFRREIVEAGGAAFPAESVTPRAKRISRYKAFPPIKPTIAPKPSL